MCICWSFVFIWVIFSICIFVFLNKLGITDRFSFLRPSAHYVFQTGLKFIAALAFQVPGHVCHQVPPCDQLLPTTHIRTVTSGEVSSPVAAGPTPSACAAVEVKMFLRVFDSLPVLKQHRIVPHAVVVDFIVTWFFFPPVIATVRWTGDLISIHYLVFKVEIGVTGRDKPRHWG